MARTERWTIRFGSEQADAIESAAEREEVTPSELIRDGAVRRAGAADGGMLVPLDAAAARRVRAAAAVDDVEPSAWAAATIEGAASRRVAGEGLSASVAERIDSDEDGRDEES